MNMIRDIIGILPGANVPTRVINVYIRINEHGSFILRVDILSTQSQITAILPTASQNQRYLVSRSDISCCPGYFVAVTLTGVIGGHTHFPPGAVTVTLLGFRWGLYTTSKHMFTYVYKSKYGMRMCCKHML